MSAVSSDRKNCVSCRHVVHQRKRNVHNLPIAPLPSSRSVHDFHKFGIHPNSTAPGFHFHLAGCINPDTGETPSFTKDSISKQCWLSGFDVTNMTASPCGGVCVCNRWLTIIEVWLWPSWRRPHNSSSRRWRVSLASFMAGNCHLRDCQ